MLEFITVFFIFLYFKIARVHKKEEKLVKYIYIQHIIVAIFTIVLYSYLFSHETIVKILIESFISFIIAALMITAVQVGIFLDGKPFIKLSVIYKYLYIITILIVLLTLILVL